ncbi:hypothetical protein D210916BOD24_32000 [Alteromonas sp. D210916BOD_24]|uniref:hypothetical protein n=1 Tax=Alteromonas sp. D210916BOD_24 TaxID=3157618 RepID=UPI00399D04B6
MNKQENDCGQADQHHKDNELQQGNDLAMLWQTQSVSPIDIDAVKKSFYSEQKKQRLYIVIDLLPFIPAVYMLITFWDRLSFAAQVIQVIVFIFALPFLAYQLWLRRVAAFSKKESHTLDYLQQFTKQIRNNVKIARLNKYSALIVIPFFIVFLLERYFSGEVALEKLLRMGAVMSAISVGMLIWFVWAHKRQQRFERQLQTLIEMEENRGS